jgi:hypothetical protein
VLAGRVVLESVSVVATVTLDPGVFSVKETVLGRDGLEGTKEPSVDTPFVVV